MVEKGRRKKNDGEATVTRRSRLLSRHSARLSRECSIIARDQAQDRYRAEPRASYQRRRCYRCDRWTEVHATTRHDMKCARSLSLSLSPLTLSLSLSLSPFFYHSLAISLSHSLFFSGYRSRIYPRVCLNREITRSRSIKKFHCKIKPTMTFSLFQYNYLCRANIMQIILICIPGKNVI